jgi:hypothetical protein
VGEGTHSVDKVLEEVQQRLLQKTGNVGEYLDENTGELREYEKVNWVYPTNLFIKVSGNAPKKKFNGKEYPTHPPRFELGFRFSKNQKYCDICGDLAPVTDAKMWMFPFIVDPGKFGNFYSKGKRGINLCPRCAVAGTAGYLSWLWVAQGRDALHFFLFYSDLDEISRLQREVLHPLSLLRKSRGGNIGLPFYGPYLHETTLGLLLELFPTCSARNTFLKKEENYWHLFWGRRILFPQLLSPCMQLRESQDKHLTCKSSVSFLSSMRITAFTKPG